MQRSGRHLPRLPFLALALSGALALSTLTATASAQTAAGDAGPEAQLKQVFSDIEASRLDSALQKTEALLRQYPNFRLAHLIKGDLLLARGKPIRTFGNAENAPEDRIADLRAEAIARLRAYDDKPAPNAVPRYLLQMPADQRHAIVVDTQKSRLYLYQNDTRDGRPRFVADYYVTHGKLGAEKLREGDKKTPVGVYRITASLPAKKLGDLYGNGAYPLDYPNEWDRRQGRGGHGIWLHGTPSNTYSRPPRASDGCVVLANADLSELSKKLQIGVTPVIISNSVEWLSLDDWQAERSALNRQIEEWRTDWESRDPQRFLRHYSKRFEAGGQKFEQFARQKRQVIADKEWIKVKLSNQSVFRNPGKEEFVVVSFDQDYRSNAASNQMRKRQYWIREDGTWKIIYEGSA